jgi:hypothetical protein
MRFRAKFQWIHAITAVIWLVIGSASIWRYARGVGGDLHMFTGIVQILLGMLLLSAYAFTWWEIGDSGLVQHLGWRTQTVPWGEVVHVAPWQPGDKPVYSRLAVDYARTGPMSNRGTMVLAPVDCGVVLRAIRAHAPQAEFDFFPYES